MNSFLLFFTYHDFSKIYQKSMHNCHQTHSFRYSFKNNLHGFCLCFLISYCFYPLHLDSFILHHLRYLLLPHSSPHFKVRRIQNFSNTFYTYSFKVLKLIHLFDLGFLNSFLQLYFTQGFI